MIFKLTITLSYGPYSKLIYLVTVLPPAAIPFKGSTVIPIYLVSIKLTTNGL